MGQDVHDLAALFDEADVVADPGGRVAGVAGSDEVAGLALERGGLFVALVEGAEVFALVAPCGALLLGVRGLLHRRERGLDAALFVLQVLQEFEGFFVHGVPFFRFRRCLCLASLIGEFGVVVGGPRDHGDLEEPHLAPVCDAGLVAFGRDRDEADGERVEHAVGDEGGRVASLRGGAYPGGDVQAVVHRLRVGDAADDLAVLVAELRAVRVRELAVSVEGFGSLPCVDDVAVWDCDAFQRQAVAFLHAAQAETFEADFMLVHLLVLLVVPAGLPSHGPR